MIDQSQEVLAMATLAVDRAVHTELEAFAQGVVADRTGDIATLQAMLQTWYGIAYTPPAADAGRLESLSGEDFEEAFMTRLIRADRQSVRGARHCAARADHPELISFCFNQAAEETGEIDQLSNWLCAWYGSCH
jgi:uncharacterized protein (DUF305 family)